MNNLDNVFKAENEALQAMVDSMIEGINQAEGWGDSTTEIMAVSCPKAAEMLAMIGAGQISKEDADIEMLIGIAGDLGHDVSFGLYNLNAKTKVVRRSVHQPINLAKGVEWGDIISVMKIAIDYMNERIRLNNLAFK